MKFKKLGEIIDLISGQHVNADLVTDLPEGKPYLTGPSDFIGNYIQKSKYTKYGTKFCQKGDILITVKGSGAGTMAWSDEEYAISRQLMAIRGVNDNTEFLWFCLGFQFEKIKLKASGTIPGLSRPDIENIEIPDFPIAEQKKIAEILGTCDRQIELTEKLINAKRKLKRGLMQKLLTGKLRFPEFEGNFFKKVNLGDCLERIIGGGTPSREIKEYWNGDIDWATVKDFRGIRSSQTEETITKIGLNKSASNLIPAYTVIVATRMAVGKAIIFDKDVAINQDLKALFVKPFLNSEYLLFFFNLFGEKFLNTASGSTVKGITIDFLKKIKIDLPDIEEQKKIVNLFKSFEKEINVLEEMLNFLKQQKKGLMQQLLTGKTRVNLNP